MLNKFESVYSACMQRIIAGFQLGTNEFMTLFVVALFYISLLAVIFGLVFGLLKRIWMPLFIAIVVLILSLILNSLLE